MHVKDLRTTSFRRGNNSQRNAALYSQRSRRLRKVALETYRGGVLCELSPPTDWRNGSASDSSPEGYAFESRIGH